MAEERRDEDILSSNANFESVTSMLHSDIEGLIGESQGGLVREEEIEATGSAPSAGEVRGNGNLFVQMIRVFSSNYLAVAAVIYMVALVLFCYVGPNFYHTNQLDANAALNYVNQAPGPGFPLGADSSGFDIIGRIMFAGQASLTLGFLAGLIAVTFGAAYGLISGYVGGATDTFLMRCLDVLLSIPGLFLLLALISLFARSEQLLIIVLGVTGWYGVARILRAEALALRDREFAQAVRSMGGTSKRIIWRHILPNSMSTMVTLATFTMGDAILALSALGYLGLGIPLPQTDWGSMIQAGSLNFQVGYWWQIWPVTIVFLLVVLSINYIGDALRDAFETRLRER